MPFVLNVNLPEQDALEFTLADGRYRIGSNSECEVHVPHEEVGKVAAHIDVRGEAVFLRNLNPYPIYVGEFELSSSQQGEWPSGQTVLLTQNVSLDLFVVQQKSGDKEAAEAVKRGRSTVQIAIVVLCIGLGYYLLANESGTQQDSTSNLEYSFTDLVEQLEQEQPANYEKVLRDMIDARVIDVRWGSDDPRRAIAAYQLLLDEPLVREGADRGETAAGRIRQFALARVDDLSSLLAVE